MRRFPPTFPPITLRQFALQRLKATVSWIEWVDTLGLGQATKRACCAMYQDWLGYYFPKDGMAELGRIECERLRDAWLDIGHPAGDVAKLFAIGSREDRWNMPDAAALARLQPIVPAGAVYCPEMGEQAPSRLFHSEHNYAGTYSLCWKTGDDQAARARLRELRIFPRRVEYRTPAEWLEAKRLGSDVFSCLITSKAHGKLRDANLVAIRTLLD